MFFRKGRGRRKFRKDFDRTLKEIFLANVFHPLGVSSQEVIAGGQRVRKLNLTAAKAIGRIDDFLLDKLVFRINQLDIDRAAKRGGKVKWSLSQVSLEPNRFARSIGLPVLMEIDFFLRQLGKVSLEGSNNPR